MSDKILGLLGLMRRSSSVEIGEEKTRTAARAGKARLILLASDASENAGKRAEGFAAMHGTQLAVLPYTKEQVSAAVGVNGCSMAAVTDMGFANALMKALSELNSEEYGEAAEKMRKRF